MSVFHRNLFGASFESFSEKRLAFFTAEDHRRQKEYETQEGEKQQKETDKWDTYAKAEEARKNASSYVETQLKKSPLLSVFGSKDNFIGFSHNQIAHRYVAEVKDLHNGSQRDIKERFHRYRRELIRSGSEAALDDRDATQQGLENAKNDLDPIDKILENSYDVTFKNPPGAYQKKSGAQKTRLRTPKTPGDVAKMSEAEKRRYWAQQSGWSIDYKIADAKDTLSQFGVNKELERTEGKHYYLHCAKTLRKAIQVLERRNSQTNYLENKKVNLEYIMAQQLLIGKEKSDGSKVTEAEATTYINHVIDNGSLHADHAALVKHMGLDLKKEERDWQRRLQGRMPLRNLFRMEARGTIGKRINEGTANKKTRDEMRAEVKEGTSLANRTIKFLKEGAESKPKPQIIPGTELRFELNPIYEKEFRQKCPGLSLASLQHMEVTEIKGNSMSFKSALDNGKTSFSIDFGNQTFEVSGETFPLNKYFTAEPKIIKDQNEKDASISRQMSKLFLEKLRSDITADDMEVGRSVALEFDLSKTGAKVFKDQFGISWAKAGKLSVELNAYDNEKITMTAKNSPSKEKLLKINLNSGEFETNYAIGKKNTARLSQVLDDADLNIIKK